MARPIVLGNGTLHVGINKFGLVHDFYYPYVGGENHAAAQSLRHRIGVWADGAFSWFDDGSWTFSFDYLEHSLIGVVTARCERLGILIESTDAVEATNNAFMRNLHIVNTLPEAREIRVFFQQAFDIGNSRLADTAQVIPDERAVLHYKGQRYFMIGGATIDGRSFSRYAVGSYGIEGHEGAYRDAEDGELSGNPVEHGGVDSVIGFDISLAAHDSTRLEYWIAAGERLDEARDLHRRLQHDGLLHYLLKTDAWWDKWLQKTRRAADRLPKRFRGPFIKSAMIVKAHIDSHGAVIASTDTTMLNYSRDSYAYCWPRDAAYALWPLVRLGYTDEILNFFAFCERVMHVDGYLMHKYLPDGALGSSWHPYVHGERSAPPVQEDETAIVVFLFARYYAMHHKRDVLDTHYETMIVPMANFLADYIDPSTHLPLPSYDLWERLHSTTTYTTALVYGSLVEASRLAEAFGDTDHAVRWRAVAESIKAHAAQLYDPETGCFIKGLERKNGELTRDTTIDISSVYGAYMFGLFDIDSSEVSTSLATCRSALSVHDGVPAIARFADDEYNRSDPSRVGNPWYIATLWLAQHALEKDQTDEGIAIIEWVTRQMMSSGVLAEQCDPDTYRFISVAPLTWSQAEYVNCLLDTIPQEHHL